MYKRQVQIEAKLNEKNIPRNMIGREKRVVALEQYLSQARNYDPVRIPANVITHFGGS